MTPENLFLVCNYGILPAWLLLALAPRWVGTQRIVHAVWIPLILGPVYIWALASSNAPPEGGFSTLAEVMALFTDPITVLAGWVHYLIFDLFIGAWELRDSQRRGIRHVWMLPCLFFTLMVGPAGLLFYLVLRASLTRELSLQETAA